MLGRETQTLGTTLQIAATMVAQSQAAQAVLTSMLMVRLVCALTFIQFGTARHLGQGLLRDENR